jgi:hypothetical protein
MNDLELLEMYEPTLRFAKSERFFPMAVEPYLEHCTLSPYSPESMVEYLEYREKYADFLSARIGHLKNENFFLRFVNKKFDNSSAWRWLLAFSLVGLVIGWLLFGLTGVEIDLVISFAAALFLFMLASPVRLRIIPSALAVIAFCALSFAPLRFFINPSGQINIAIEYLIILPIYVAALFYILIRILQFTIDRIIPEGPGMIMDMLSSATEKVAEEAYKQYARILKKDPQPVYYGRVLHEKDSHDNRWTILQYHFFYAFNDWRLAANGMNHHEGDWELVAVYLKNDSPYSVLFSQHGSGSMEKWENLFKVKDEHGADTPHPVVYVALGSHANYSRAGEVRSPSMYEPGKIQRLMFWLDGMIHFLFLWLNPHQRKVAMDAIKEQQTHVFDEEVLANMRYAKDKYVVRLPLEIASGDGFRIGPHLESIKEPQTQSSKLLKWQKSRRKTTLPALDCWQRVLLNSDCDWVQYKGLWGVKSWLNEESGPPGPRWERPRKNQTAAQERIRWGSPLQWLEKLEKNLHS